MSEEHGEQKEGASTSAPTWTRVVGPLLLLAMLLGTIGLMVDYNEAPEPEPAHGFPDTRSWRVGTPGTYYIWTNHQQTLQSSMKLEQVPGWAHTVLELWHPEWGPRPEHEGGYIVDIRGVKPGEVLTAKLKSRAYIWSALHAADEGDATGTLTTFLAQEVAASHPDSTRTRTAEAAIKELEKLEARRPPTREEVLAAYRKKLEELQQASRQR